MALSSGIFLSILRFFDFVEIRAEEKHELKTWILDLINPRYNFLSILLLSTTCGVLFIFCSIIVSRSFDRVTGAMKELKPVVGKPEERDHEWD